MLLEEEERGVGRGHRGRVEPRDRLGFSSIAGLRMDVLDPVAIRVRG